MHEPISTAPKDGTRILALCADGITKYCWWVGCNEYEGFWMTEQECCPLTWNPDKRLSLDMPTPMSDGPKPPLWRAMEQAYFDADAGWNEGARYAAEIRALADWLAPKETAVRSYFRGHLIRKMLLAEADRAEAGE